MYEYKYKIDLVNYKSITLEELQKHAQVRDDYYKVDGVLSVTPEFVDSKNIVIDNSINIAQAGGNTPQEIGQYTQIFNEERFNPLQKIPFLRDPKAPLKIPFTGIDYNKITD